MANKRMFTMSICDSDAFLDMPLSSQCLYFHLNMRADDDGFIGNPKRVIKMINASEDDLKLLLAKRFILAFESGVIVIKHWRMHNTLKGDRYKQTTYQDELKQLTLKENKSYTITHKDIDNIELETNWKQNGTTVLGLETETVLGLETETDIDSGNIFAQVVEYLNQKSNKHFRLTDATKKLIKTRLKEGFLIDDFYRVIDNQCSKWLNDPKMSDYLRPQTLFGTKFESYLNTTKTKKFDIMDL